MVSAITTAVSGFNAASKQISVNANNIANEFSIQTVQNGAPVNSPYVPQQVVQASQANGGVTATAEPVNPASVSVYDPSNAAAGGSGATQYPNVDPAQQLEQTNIASYDAKANLSVIKVADKNFQSLLNIVA